MACYIPAMPEALPLTLITLSGPSAVTQTLAPGAVCVVGRSADSSICLLNERVSRRHAVLLWREGHWFALDEASAHGTFVNGVRLVPGEPAILNAGDLLRIGPWTMRVTLGSRSHPLARTIDDSAAPRQRIERADSSVVPGAQRRLRLLTDLIARFNAGATEADLADFALESALKGTGYARGAVVKLAHGSDDVEVVQTRLPPEEKAVFTFSNSLIEAAAAGQSVVLTRDAEQVSSHSIARMDIHSAICTPVLIEEAVAAFLYLDARGRESAIRPDAAGFCEAVARALGLALANLKRADLEKRQRVLTSELNAAREAQQFILPPPRGEVGRVRYAMRMRPGIFVAGDLFDVLALPDGRTAFCLGDVAGHGAGSGMLMASAQAFLHAYLESGRSPAQAVGLLNRFLSDRLTAGRFVSLFLGVLDPDGTLEFVDAGHGHWLLLCAHPGETPSPDPECIPLGIDPDHAFASATVRMHPGDRLILFSDGLIDQRAPGGEEFGMDRLREALSASANPDDDIQHIFDRVLAFAQTSSLDDDATAASFEFTPASA